MLERRLSPQQISARLKLDYPADREMRIAPETIYQSLYVQSRGRLRKDLTGYLRSGRAARKPRGSSSGGAGKIKHMVSISQRPAEVADRAVPGHWEGDLIVGKQNRSYIGTLVERHTRYVMLSYLGSDARTETVTNKIAEQIMRLPEQLRRSLTWDQGREMHAISSSPSPPGPRSTSAIPTHRGSGAQTRTPTGCCASTSPRAPTWPCTARSTSTESQPSSTADQGKRSTGEPQLRR